MVDRALVDFQRGIRIVPADKAQAIRQRYQHAFLDILSDRYRRDVKELVPYPDGLLQRGYMWDCLKSYQEETWEDFWRLVCGFREVLVLWDRLSKVRIYDPDYYKLGRDTVIACTPAHLQTGLELLPRDLYIFDLTFTWSAIQTHEFHDNENQDWVVFTTPRGFPFANR